MPGKLIAFILTLLIIVTFIGFNYNNNSDITLWPNKVVFEAVPIFVSFFVMYLIGVISVIPFMIGWWRKKGSSSSAEEASPEAQKPTEKKKKNVRVLGGKKTRQKDAESAVVTDDSPDGPVSSDSNTGSGEIPAEGSSDS